MIAVTVLSWLGVVLVLASYTQVTKRPQMFDWANAICFVPVALPAIILKAYPSAAITVAFGLIGIFNVIRRKVQK